MDPKRRQHPPQARRPQKPTSPVFKTGDYVPLAILIVDGDKLKNHHLPQKLFAAKDFVQADVMLEYFFQHPQQPLMLDPNRPRPAEFNGAVCNFSNWMVQRGYCTREEGTSDLKIHVWTQEEMDTHRAEVKARREAQILAHAEAMAAGGDEGMEISQGINNLLGVSEQLNADAGKLFAEGSMDKLQNEVPVNVGTIGHVDHGLNGVNRAMERVQIEVDPADPEPETTRAFIEQELVAQRSVSDGGQAFERPADASADEPEAFLAQERPAHRYDELLLGKPEGYADLPQPVINPEVGGQIGYAPAEEPVRTPQYPLVEKSDVRLADVDNTIPLEEMEKRFSDAELLAADPKGGL